MVAPSRHQPAAASRPPPPPPRSGGGGGLAPASQLWRTGCLGAALGLAVAAGLAVFIALWTAYVGPLTPPVSDPSRADITITVQEAYLNQVLAQSLPPLPSGLATDVRLDLQPGGRVAFTSRLQSTLLGQNFGGDTSGVVLLQVRDGQLAISFGEVTVLGFSLPAIGQTLANELAGRMNQVINDQIRSGLGQNAYLMSLTTDDRQMVIRARWR